MGKRVWLWIFLAVLMSSSVLALEVASIAGAAGIEGFRAREEDTITAFVSSMSAGVTMADVTDSCQGDYDDSTNRYLYTCSITDTAPADATEMPYMFEDSAGGSLLRVVQIDSMVPSVDFSMDLVQGKLRINYTISDPEPYSGLATITVVVNDNELFADGLSGCAAEGVILLGEEEGLASGEQNVHLVVADLLGNTNTTADQAVHVDISPPEAGVLTLTRMNMQPLGKVALGSTHIINLNFTVQESNLTLVRVDVAPLHQPRPPSAEIIASCSPNTADPAADTDTFTCVVLNQQATFSTEQVVLDVYMEDAYGNAANGQLTYDLETDNAEPSISGIRTSYCTDTQCYAKNGMNRIFVSLDSSKTYDEMQVYLLVGSQRVRVTRCEEAECSVQTQIPCVDGESISLAIADGSRDDAGNPLPDAEAIVRCDATPPEILAITYESSDQYGLTITGSSVTITANISDANPVRATLNLSLIQNNEVVDGICTQVRQGLHQCTWTAGIPEGEDPFVADLFYTFYDVVNNSVTNLTSMPVLGVYGEDEVPGFFTMSIDDQGIRPQRVSRITLGLMLDNNIPYPVFVPFLVSSSAADASVLKQHVEGCVYQLSERSEDTDDLAILDMVVQDEQLDKGQPNRINAKFAGVTSAELNSLPARFYALCNISLFTRKGDRFYTSPQIVQVKIPFNLREAYSDVDHPGEQFVKKIKKIEDSNWAKMGWVTKINRIAADLQQVCNINAILTTVQSVGVDVSAAGRVLMGTAGPAAEVMTRAGSATHGNAEMILSKIDWGVMGQDIDRIVGQVCDFLSCRTSDKFMLKTGIAQDWDAQLLGLSGSSGGSSSTPNGLLDYKSVLDNLGTSNPYNSIVMSTVKMCLPAVVYNVDKWRQEQCEYLSCLKEYSVRGLDVSNCDTLHKAKQCQFIVGEIFELPFVRMGKNFFTNVNDLAQTLLPTAMWQALNVWPCKGSEVEFMRSSEMAIRSPLLFAGCAIPRNVYSVLKVTRQSAMNNNFAPVRLPDICSVALCSGPNCHASGGFWDVNVPRLPEQNLEDTGGDIRGLYQKTLNYALVQSGARKDGWQGITRRDAERSLPASINELNRRIRTYNAQFEENDPRRLEEFSGDISPQAIKNNYDRNKGHMAGRSLQRLPPSNPISSIPWEAWNAAAGGDVAPPEGSLVRTNDGKMYQMFNNHWIEVTSSTYDRILGNDIYHATGPLLSYDQLTAMQAAINGYMYVGQGSVDIDSFNPATLSEEDRRLWETAGRDIVNQYRDYLRSSGYSEAELEHEVGLFQSDIQGRTEGRVYGDYEVDQLVEQRRRELTDGNPDNGEETLLLDERLRLYKTSLESTTTRGMEDDIILRTRLSNFQSSVEATLRKENLFRRWAAYDRSLNAITRWVLNDLGFKKYLTTEHLFKQWFGLDISGALAWTDPEQYKASLCNPNNNIFGGNAPQGAVYSCRGGCTLVLSFGAERIAYNESHTIYTLVYYLGPVADVDVKYRVELRGSRTVNINLEEWKVLPKGQVLSEKFTAVSKYDYSRMCLVFESHFPPSDATQEKEYCRDIKENTLNTGEPYFAPGEGGISGSGGGTQTGRNPDI